MGIDADRINQILSFISSILTLRSSRSRYFGIIGMIKPSIPLMDVMDKE
jgi:hypothetical protein